MLESQESLFHDWRSLRGQFVSDAVCTPLIRRDNVTLRHGHIDWTLFVRWRLLSAVDVHNVIL